MDLRQYQREFFKSIYNFDFNEILTHYELPNNEELHTMVCGYNELFKDAFIFDCAESIDYLKYERQLWKEAKKN